MSVSLVFDLCELKRVVIGMPNMQEHTEYNTRIVQNVMWYCIVYHIAQYCIYWTIVLGHQ